MNNVFPVGLKINFRFDLKGSTINRFVEPEKREQPGSTWKENEFSEGNYLKGLRDWTHFRQNLFS